MEWSVADFYSSGGVVSFTDKLAATLGVHASRIKIVAIYEGSTIADYIIEALAVTDEGEEVSEEDQETELAAKLQTMVS